MTSIVWFRQDLRIGENPALQAALENGGAVIPVYVWDPAAEGVWRPGAASRWWLHHSLISLERSLCAMGSRLVIREGSTPKILAQLAKQTSADRIYWNRRYEPLVVARDKTLAASLQAKGIRVEISNGSLLTDPQEIKTQSGGPYKVFTPYWRTLQKTIPPFSAIPRVAAIPSPKRWPLSISVDALKLLPEINWAKGFSVWEPGEAGAQKRWKKFLGSPINDYQKGRDLPGTVGSSRLSPHLHFGEISPQQIWRDVSLKMAQAGFKGGEVYLREIAWREFAYHLLHHFPHTVSEPLRPEFAKFPWRHSASELRRWHKGMTGFPIVDAGMRELWTTGWMHNRVRMIAGSFLVKDLMLPWQAGARWFWDTLVDADLANNTLGWQWIAGCGADAAPYFRVFNPTTQAKRYDPRNQYIHHWVLELKNKKGNYIAPIVNHDEARTRALTSFYHFRKPRR